jgi:hypothetical protein
LSDIFARPSFLALRFFVKLVKMSAGSAEPPAKMTRDLRRRSLFSTFNLPETPKKERQTP